MWVLIDNLDPNKPVLINLDKVTDVAWDSGTLVFEFEGASTIEVEASKEEFLNIAGKLNIVHEVE